MPKRKTSNNNAGQRYGKRRRHFSVSPSYGDDIITENRSRLKTLQLEVDILRAQLVLLRAQLDELCQERLTAEKVKESNCQIM